MIVKIRRSFSYVERCINGTNGNGIKCNHPRIKNVIILYVDSREINNAGIINCLMARLIASYNIVRITYSDDSCGLTIDFIKSFESQRKHLSWEDSFLWRNFLSHHHTIHAYTAIITHITRGNDYPVGRGLNTPLWIQLIRSVGRVMIIITTQSQKNEPTYRASGVV